MSCLKMNLKKGANSLIKGMRGWFKLLLKESKNFLSFKEGVSMDQFLFGEY